MGPGQFGGIAINITGRHLSDSHFTHVLIEALAQHGMTPGSMSIEITERVLMEASNSALEGLGVIRSLGVKVGLDDFGTGYSSLAYLRQFPLDFVKIDSSCIRQLADNTSERAMVTAIIGMAHALQLSVVAEGVETPEELAILKALGCDRAQGFLFSHPVDASTFGALLANGSTLTPEKEPAAAAS